MSHLLWKYYVEGDVDRFQALLSNASHAPPPTPRAVTAGSFGTHHAATTAPGASPRPPAKSRKVSGHTGTPGGAKYTLHRADVNARDHAGLTLLHRAASNNDVTVATALLQHPAIDLYAQDAESGWTALHRALYSGNISIARAILHKDFENTKAQSATGTRAGYLIKIKDREGNSAFDVYNATIAKRALRARSHRSESNRSSESEEDADDVVEDSAEGHGIDGDEVFSFGSNKNLTLGFGDEDDRQFPERIVLKRPDHLVQKLYKEQLEDRQEETEPELKPLAEIPTLTQHLPIVIHDMALSKLSSAILTTDRESNLYMCGYGKGGRLGTGDERTRFQYVCIEGGALAGKQIAAVALGQNHTMAIATNGETYTWGTNTWGQLGYNLPRPTGKDEEPVNCVPRQIYGTLKNERILGIAASGIHSVAHTPTALYTWGKNEGQLGLMDSDSRSLEAQTTPRKIAASQFNAPIKMVSAINRATICLLANHTVRVFTNYGYKIVKFPLQEGFTRLFLPHRQLASLRSTATDYDRVPNHISMITSGGDTIAAVSSRGDLFTVNVSQKLDPAAATSTTNPAKIKDALSQPVKVWSLRKGNWDGIKSVAVGEDESVILCTQAGAVFRRVKRLTQAETKRKDYKFQRIPGLTNAVAVRSNVFGAYAAVRKDCDITKTQVMIGPETLWTDLAPLFALQNIQVTETQVDEDWVSKLPDQFGSLRRAALFSSDIEADVVRHLRNSPLIDESYNVVIASTVSDVGIPAHSFMLSARSPVLRHALRRFYDAGSFTLPDTLSISVDPSNRAVLTFHGLDFLALLNVAAYIYTDSVIDVWQYSRLAPKMAFRFRQVRTELMKLAGKLKMSALEDAARLMQEPEPQLHADMDGAILDPDFFDDADAIIELNDSEVSVHSSLMCQRCPFFDGLFNGRTGGQWLAGRRDGAGPVRIDMQHVDADTFQFVLRFLYADIGSNLFDDVVCSDIDEFCELVMNVMDVANELMLDRLAQICQNIVGRFVTMRNVCPLLNVVASCAVTKFKDAALEYLCLQLEAMLGNHLLDELDEDLMLELDEVVHANQLDCLKHVRDGTVDALLHEKYPSLGQDIQEERQRQVRDMAFRVALRDEQKLSSSFRARVGSLDEVMSSSPSQDKAARAKPRGHRNAPFSPSIRAKDSSADLMFDMDDDEINLSSTPPAERHDWLSPTRKPSAALSPKDVWQAAKGKAVLEDDISPIPSPALTPGRSVGGSVPTTKNTTPTNELASPWAAKALPESKLGIKDIMEQASASRTSNLSLGLSAQKKDESSVKSTSQKLSQKERKRQQQQSLQQTAEASDAKSSPWQLPKNSQKTLLKDIVVAEAQAAVDPTSRSSTSTSPVPHRRTASPDTRHSGQQRNAKPKSTPLNGPSKGPSYLAATSKTYNAEFGSTKAAPSVQLSFADIIGQQKLEQDQAREAASAKRSLQEIQEEQAFQEWWDKESRRAQEEEEERRRNAAGAASGAGSSRRAKAKKKPADKEKPAATLTPPPPSTTRAQATATAPRPTAAAVTGKASPAIPTKPPHPHPSARGRGKDKEKDREREKGKDRPRNQDSPHHQQQHRRSSGRDSDTAKPSGNMQIPRAPRGFTA